MLGLVINPDKMLAINIGGFRQVTKADCRTLLVVTFNNTRILYTDTLKIVVVTFDQNLHEGPPITEVSKGVFAAVMSLRKPRSASFLAFFNVKIKEYRYSQKYLS